MPTKTPAAAARRVATLYVDGVGYRVKNGYEIHWHWAAHRDSQKIDGGVLTGGNIPEFYETWPDARGEADIVKQMKKILRDEWIATGEFGSLPAIY